MEDLFSKVWELLTIYGLKVIAAIAVFVIGRWIAKILTTFTEKLMNKKQVDPTIVSFVANLIYIIPFPQRDVHIYKHHEQ